MIRTVNEWGVFSVLRGLTSQEFNKAGGSIKGCLYKEIYGDLGFSRCNLCLIDFAPGDKLKQFPHCDHLFHPKCLELWCYIEPRCPNCQRTYSPNPTVVG